MPQLAKTFECGWADGGLQEFPTDGVASAIPHAVNRPVPWEWPWQLETLSPRKENGLLGRLGVSSSVVWFPKQPLQNAHLQALLYRLCSVQWPFASLATASLPLGQIPPVSGKERDGLLCSVSKPWEASRGSPKPGFTQLQFL